MDIEKLKAAIEQLREMLLEIETEVNDFHWKKSDWYYNQLCQHYSGLFSDEEFHSTFNKCVELSNDFEVQFALQAIENIATGYESFLKKNEELQNVIVNAENRVPNDWKLYKVKYKDEYSDVYTPEYVYAPNEEQAKEKVMALHGNPRRLLDFGEVTEEKE